MRASPWYYVALTVLIAVVPAISAFLVLPLQRRSFGVYSRQPTLIKPLSQRRQSCFCMSAVVSTDPFQVLNLSPTSDKKEIKRAYRRMALKYHPDVVTNQDTSAKERKKANDEFAKINWAYAQLSGKSGTSSTTTSTSSSSTSSSSSHSPPHHRTSSDTYNPNKVSTDWRDYMYNPYQASTDWQDCIPKYNDKRVYDEQVYDTGGDSFDKILSDIFKGAAVGAAGVAGGGRGIFRDFVEFLESNVNGYAGEEKDAELRVLLNTASVEYVGKEMDDAELVVQQMELKRRNLADELIILEAYLTKMGLDEKVAEMEARKRVVDGNIKKAREWLLALQTRHKELLVRGDDNVRAGGHSSSWEPQASSPYSTSSPSATSSASPRGTSTGASSASSEENAWKHEGFDSIGRGRNSSRRSRGRDVHAGGHSSSWEPQSSPPYSTSSPGATSYVSQRGTSSDRSTDYSSASSKQDAWKHEGFGSSGRGRDSSRRSRGSGVHSVGRSNLWEPHFPSAYSTSSPGATSSASSREAYSDRSTDFCSASSEEDAWKHEGFGSIGRGRGSSRRSHRSDVRSEGFSSSREPQSSSPYSTSSPGATYSASPRGASSVGSMDSSSACSEEAAWKHEGFASSGRGRGTFHHRARRFASRMLHRYRQNPDRNKSSPPVPVAEMEARKQVVDGNLKKARKWLLALQTRHKELLVRGDDNVRAGGRSSSWEPQSSSPYSTSSPGATFSASPRGTSTGASSASSEENAWKHEGFGSIGRGRNSSRRSRGRDVHAEGHSTWEPQSSSPYSTSLPGATSSVSPRGTSSDRSTDYSSGSSEEAAWKHEGFGSSGRGRGTFHHRARRFASRMLHRYRQNPDRNKSSPPDSEKRRDIDPKQEMREKSKKRKGRKDELLEATRKKKESVMKRVASLATSLSPLQFFV